MATAAAQLPADKRFGAVLRRYRVAAALSQEASAGRAGLSTRAVSDPDRGARRGTAVSTVL